MCVQKVKGDAVMTTEGDWTQVTTLSLVVKDDDDNGGNTIPLNHLLEQNTWPKSFLLMEFLSSENKFHF